MVGVKVQVYEVEEVEFHIHFKKFDWKVKALFQQNEATAAVRITTNRRNFLLIRFTKIIQVSAVKVLQNTIWIRKIKSGVSSNQSWDIFYVKKTDKNWRECWQQSLLLILWIPHKSSKFSSRYYILLYFFYNSYKLNKYYT